MKILFVAHNFPPVSGGISQIMYTMCKGMPAESVVVLAPWGNTTSAHAMLNSSDRTAALDIDSSLAFPVYRAEYSMRTTLSTVLSVLRFALLALRLARRHRVDLVYFSHAYPTAISGLLFRVMGYPYVVHTYGSELVRKRTGLPYWLRQQVLRRAFRITAISEWGKSCLVGMGIPSDRVVVIHPKIELERFAPPPDLEAFKRRERLDGKLVILSVGHLVHRKGQHLVLQALPEILARFPEAVYVIAGAGPGSDDLKKLASELGVADHVLFPGNRDIVSFYHACDIFILPSLYIGPPVGDIESFGVVYIEASACGKPAVGADNGGIPDAVADGESGLLVKTDDVPSIVSVLCTLLEDSELRERLGKQGLERVHREFLVERYADDVRRLILEPLQGSQR